MSSQQSTLLGIGNPLLDIVVNDAEDSLFERFEVKLGLARLAEPKHVPIYDEIQKREKIDYIAGGAAQNSMRATSWILGGSEVNYIGCVGNDSNAKILKDEAEKQGVKTHYLIDAKERTGTCAVLIKDKERSLVANLAAANCYKKTHLEKEEIFSIVEKSSLYYATSFFLTVSPESLVKIGEHAVEKNKPFLLNIAAVFLVQFFSEPMETVLPYVDIVFGNEDESAAYGIKQGWITEDNKDLELVAKKLSLLPKKNTKRDRIVVFTHGPQDTIVCIKGEIKKYSPIPCKKEEIVDLNGAGDCFVGGFLAGLMKGKGVEDCIKAAHYLGYECIKQSGVRLTNKPTFKWE